MTLPRFGDGRQCDRMYMTETEVPAAIDGAILDVDGNTWRISVAQMDIKAPDAYAVHLAIKRSPDYRGALVINSHKPVAAKWLRSVAIGTARSIVMGKLPPGAKEPL